MLDGDMLTTKAKRATTLTITHNDSFVVNVLNILLNMHICIYCFITANHFPFFRDLFLLFFSGLEPFGRFSILKFKCLNTYGMLQPVFCAFTQLVPEA